MEKRVQYMVSVGGVYLEPLYFDTLEKAEECYKDELENNSDAYVGLAKVTTEWIKHEYIPFREDDDDE